MPSSSYMFLNSTNVQIQAGIYEDLQASKISLISKGMCRCIEQPQQLSQHTLGAFSELGIQYIIHSDRKKKKENRILFPHELKLAPDDSLDYGGCLS